MRPWRFISPIYLSRILACVNTRDKYISHYALCSALRPTSETAPWGVGRSKGTPNQLDVPESARPALAGLLAGLGVTEDAVTESYGGSRTQLNINMRIEERRVLDAAAVSCGLPGAQLLVRVIARSWLIHEWNHPPEIDVKDLGDALLEVAEWPSAVAGPSIPLATMIRRLGRADRLQVLGTIVAELSPDERVELIHLLDGEVV